MDKIYMIHELFQNAVVLIDDFSQPSEVPAVGRIVSQQNFIRENGDEEYQEGDYVKEVNEAFMPANDSEVAIVQRQINETLRDEIKRNHLQLPSLPVAYPKVDEIHSYHVNIGHGNCSIIVFRNDGQYYMWMVDCSIFDITNKTYYTDNLDKCLSEIKEKFGITTISRLMITHVHYDHINGIKYLMRRKTIGGKYTEVWLNCDYQWGNKTYNDILAMLIADGYRIILPVVKNSTDNLEIMYPQKNICNPKYSVKGCVPAPDNKVNNASVIYKIAFGEFCMVLPGDIEVGGWKATASNGVVHVDYDNYYCHSHHGSENGLCIWPHTFCSFPVRAGNRIVMGRDGAYSGIYGSTVKNDIVARGTYDIPVGVAFLHLNWLTGVVDYS